MHSTRSQLPFAVVVASLIVAGCAAAPPPFDAAAESAKLMQRDSEWSALGATKDVEKAIAYWSDDAVVMENGQAPVEGKQALRAYVTESMNIPGFSIHWVSQKPTFSPDGKLAYMRGKTEMTVPGPKGAPMALHLQGYSVWRKEPDGLWRCVVDIANERAPEPAPATTKK